MLNHVDEKERQKAIESLEECICVDASAGTGKTTLLTERLMNVILSGERLQNIAAITFTEKAAGELKLRVYEKLEQRLANSKDKNEKKILRAALQDLEISQISTIHSFAANLIRTRPVEAFVDPDFDILDEQEANLLATEVWERWLIENFTEDDWVLGIGMSLGLDPGNFRALARAVYSNRDAISFLDIGEPDHDTVQSLIRSAEKEVGRIVLELEDMMRSLLGFTKQEPRGVVISALWEEEDNASKQIAVLFSLWEAFERSGRHADFVHFAYQMSKYHRSISNKPAAARKWRWGTETNQKQRDLRKKLLGSINQFIQDLGKTISPGLLRRICSYIEMVDAEKERLGVLDFHDLLLRARNLLMDNRGVRQFFQKEYSHILVDEFQDTDPLQAEIIFFLCEKEPKAKAWHEVKLKPGKLFIVGDPKQSIYRFRRADIEVYDKTKNIIGEKSTVTICRNFRSVGPIINWVNAVFEKIMRPTQEDIFQAKYQPISCSRENTSLGVEVYSISGEFTLKQLREPLAEFIAQKIEKLVESGFEVKKSNGKKGPVSYGDICILLRKLNEVNYYENALKRHDIPYRTEGGKSFFSKQEIVDLRNVLQAIDNPYDELAIVGTLRSPFFSISDRELAEHRQAGKSFNYCEASDDESRINRALRILKNIHQSRHSQPFSEIINKLFEETKILQKYALFDESLQLCGNLLRLVEMVTSMTHGSAVQFSDFVHWLNLMSDEEMELAEVPLEEGEGNFVQLISIHRAKGLEFPVVFIAPEGKAKGRELAKFIIRHSAMKAAYKIEGIESEGYRELEQWDRASNQAEECRLFYVAATRAKDLLCLFDLSRTRTKDHMWYQSMLDEVLDLCEPYMIEVDAAAITIPGEKLERFKEKPADTTVIQAIEKDWLDSHKLALARGSHKVSFQSATEYEKEPIVAKKPHREGIRIFEAVGLGTAFHEAMERIPFECNIETVEKIVEAVALKHRVERHIDKLEHLCMNVLSSPIWERAKNARRAFREMPFSVNRNGTVMTGYIDLVIEEEDGVAIIDYKSDNVSKEEVKDRADFYRKQAEFYREAIKHAGIPVKDVILFFANPKIQVRLSS